MVFDERSGVCVLFGGSTGNQVHGDTWTWNGSSWSQAMPVHAPSARDVHGMTYDELDKRVVLFGGSSVGAPPARNDSWIWDGTDWTQCFSLHSPAARRAGDRRGSGLCAAGDERSSILATALTLATASC